jgi:ribosome-binding factor A
VADPRRIKRLEQLILEAAAQHVQRELDDPRIGLVTLTRVKLARDLSRAQLYWSVLGDEGTVRTTERGLNDALGSIQRAVAHAMQTRVTPRLGLIHDSTLAHAERLETIFTQLRDERGDEPEAAPEGAEETEGSSTEGEGSEDASPPSRPESE